ncbi:hypothetical protein CFC21_075600 [Triticum aestivum]|uniref:Uncharacterized protein n=3 Tax=Triticinae TaxID=1648030 RepID=A0A3B6MIL8_WHEAT|nr:uncharacterized protein LOC109741418 [Aegilops tauschii subsp. strangulata]KAF7070043.1 hypothetical protein CFC21_075600 [Triticum aestivum]
MKNRGLVYRRASDKLSITLLIDTKAAKVCFAEAGNDVVEFLSGLLSLPLGTIGNLLTKERMAGSAGNLLASVQMRDADYMGKEQHLSPAVPWATLCRLEELLGAEVSNCHTRFYTCENRNTGRSCGFLSASSDSACPACKGRMFDPMHVRSENEEVTAASRASVYTIKDYLMVSPAPSLLSGITLFAHCGVTDLSVLEKKSVKIGKEEALGILAAALKSKTVLTDVFLPKKNARCKREPPEEVIYM